MRALIIRTSMALVCLSAASFLAGVMLIYFLVLRLSGANYANAIGPFLGGQSETGTAAFAVILVLSLVIFFAVVALLVLKLVFARFSNRQFYFVGGSLVLIVFLTILLNVTPLIYIQVGTTAQWLIMATAIGAYFIYSGLAIYEWRRHEK